MLRKIESTLICPIPRRYRAGLREDQYRSHSKLYIMVGVMIMIFEVFAFLLGLSKTEMPAEARATYLTLYVTLFLVTAVFILPFVIFKKAIQRHPSFFLFYGLIYVIFICLWGSFCSAFSHAVSSDISVFIYIVLATSLIVIMQPWQAMLVYILNYVAFNVFLAWFLGPNVSAYGSRVNSFVTSVLACLIAAVMYHTQAKNYMNRCIVISQNNQIQKMNEQLRRMVVTDDLTRLRNRRFLEEDMPAIYQNALDKDYTVAMMMLDIDHFKEYNDRYGHPAGDECLRRIAVVLKSYIPQSENSLIRFGGEEFLVFLENKSRYEVENIARTLREKIIDLNIEHQDSLTLRVTLSIGYCICSAQDACPMEELIQCADTALYRAKANGRDRVESVTWLGSSITMQDSAYFSDNVLQ